MYLIVKDKFIHHEGDQRSRDFPGHGYPAYTETVKSVEEFESYIAFSAEVKRLTKNNAKFRAYDAKQYIIEVETTLRMTTDGQTN